MDRGRASDDFGVSFEEIAASGAVTDLNADGKLDLAVADSNSTVVNLLLNHGGGTFTTSVDYLASAKPYSVAAADLDDDGKPDLAVTNALNVVTVLINTCLP